MSYNLKYMKRAHLLVFLLSSLWASCLMARVYDFTKGNTVELLESPQDSADLKVDLIKKAKHHIHIITFFWDETSLPARLAKELNEANKRGVEVRILTTAFPTFTTDFLGQGRRKLQANLNSKFAYLDLRPNRCFGITHSLHEKIFLVDGDVAIVGRRNISDSSLNGKDLEVKVQGEVVNQVQNHFKVMLDFILDQKIKFKCMQAIDEKCEKELSALRFDSSDKNYFPDQKKYEPGVEMRLLSHEAILNQFESSMNKVERLVQQDDILDEIIKIPFKTLRAYQYFILPTERFKKYLNDNLANGNKIEIITNSQESAKFSSNLGYIYSLPDMKSFVENGLIFYQWNRNQSLKYVHEKVLIFNEDEVVIGSHNLVTGSTGVSNEIALQIRSKDLAQRLITIFDQEKEDEKITNKVSSDFLADEINQLKNKIKLLRTKFVRGFLLELY